MTAPQASALIWLRLTLWRRRIVQQRQWGRLIVSLFAFLIGGAFSGSMAFVLVEYGAHLRSNPALLAREGGAPAVFMTWLTAALLGRLWFAFVPRSQSAFLEPRRFLAFAVPARLVSALNFAAQLCDPAWLFFWPILAAIAIALGGAPGLPGAPILLAAEALSIWAIAGALFLGAAIAAALDARVLLRRAFAVVLALGTIVGIQLMIRSGTRQSHPVFGADQLRLVSFTPPGWAAEAARALGAGEASQAIPPMLLLIAFGAVCVALGHKLSVREALRPPESGPARVSRGRGSGWRLPFGSDAFSAVLEKEAKTVLRIGWLQIVLVPIGFLVLRLFLLDPGGASWVDRRPLLFAAVYSHLGVLELATNQFGRDVDAARGWFLWPVSPRALIAAKNLVAYLLSLSIFAGLVVVTRATGPLTAEQVVIGACAHLATFPLLAILGNLVSVLGPVPVRGVRLRRVRGAGPVGARLVTLCILAVAAWGPWAMSRLAGTPPALAYVGEAIVMAVVYGGVLAASASLLETRREPLLAALRSDE